MAATVVAQVRAGRRLADLLFELDLADDRDVILAVAAELKMPVANLRRAKPDPAIAMSLPESVARDLAAIPILREEDGTVVVATSDPRPGLEGELLGAIGSQVRVVLATVSEVRLAIESVYQALAGVDTQVNVFMAGRKSHVATSGPEAGKAVTTGDAPVVQVVNMILTQALRDRASDIHVEPQDDQVRVRYRIDGVLHDVLSLPGGMSSALTSRLKIMAGMNIVERRRPQDGQIAITLEDRPLDIRAATVGTIWGEKIVLRLLDKSRPLFRLNDLGMSAATHTALSAILRSPYGMVICAGPTGSGKTTTLYASLHEVNGPESNITTIEDPVEYVVPSINQIQINEQAGVTFAAGLKAILRQDPDMILVGEIRDIETARIAVQAALTGHFVLSSLHATDAVSALYRFLEMDIEPFLVSSSVLAIVGQRLVRRSCPDCKVRYTPSPQELTFYEQAGGSAQGEFWRGEGCNFCSGTGYSDRIGVYELLTVNEEMREQIVRPNPSHDELRRIAIGNGLRPLRSEGVRLVREGVTTIAEIIRSIYTL